MYLSNPSLTESQFPSGVQLVWIQFSFSKTDCFTKSKEVSWIYYLLITGGGVGNRWIHGFFKVWAESKTQIALSRIWTLLTNSISYGDYHHAKLAFKKNM